MNIGVDAKGRQRFEVQLLELRRRRFHHDLELVVVLQTIGVFAVTAIGGPPAGLHVSGVPALRAHCPQKGRGVKGTRTDLHVQGLQYHAALIGPELLEFQDNFLKSEKFFGVVCHGVACERVSKSPLLYSLFCRHNTRFTRNRISCMNGFKSALVKLWLHACALLPLSWARAIGRGAVCLYWPFGGRSRKVTERNIQLVFPELSDDARSRLARDSLRATGELAAEMGHIWLRPWAYVQGLILSVEGVECVREAQAQGRGVILLAPHLGNWEVAGLHGATLGDLVSLYQPPKLRGIGPLIVRARQRSGATLVPTDSRGLVKLLKSVKGGKISGILPDQAPGDLASGENVPFMGVPCFTQTLASNMIRRTGALAVFTFARRVPGGFTLHYFPAEEAIYDHDNTVSLAALNRGVETCVRQCVEQYQWEYKRFRVRPRNGPGVYDDL